MTNPSDDLLATTEGVDEGVAPPPTAPRRGPEHRGADRRHEPASARRWVTRPTGGLDGRDARPAGGHGDSGAPAPRATRAAPASSSRPARAERVLPLRPADSTRTEPLRTAPGAPFLRMVCETPTYAAGVQLTVGFDLDLTLIDPRPAVAAVVAGAGRRGGRPRRPRRVGVPHRTAAGARGGRLVRARARAPGGGPLPRAHVAESGMPLITLLPGAARGRGRRARRRRPRRRRDREVRGARAGSARAPRRSRSTRSSAGCGPRGRATALREHGATVYVGDHPGDVRAAGRPTRSASGCAPAASRPRAPTSLLDDLTGFPAWWADHLLAARLGRARRGAARRWPGCSSPSPAAPTRRSCSPPPSRALGADRVVAATAVSPSLAADELPAAQAFAAALGVRHVTPGTDELSPRGLRRQRRRPLLPLQGDAARHAAPARRRARAAGGRDRHQRRRRRRRLPARHRGRRAAGRADAAARRRADQGAGPRRVRRWGLVTADKPALACLASRIAYGVQVTPSRSGPRRPRGDGAARAPRRRRATCACATSATGRRGSSWTPPRWPVATRRRSTWSVRRASARSPPGRSASGSMNATLRLAAFLAHVHRAAGRAARCPAPPAGATRAARSTSGASERPRKNGTTASSTPTTPTPKTTAPAADQPLARSRGVRGGVTGAHRTMTSRWAGRPRRRRRATPRARRPDRGRGASRSVDQVVPAAPPTSGAGRTVRQAPPAPRTCRATVLPACRGAPSRCRRTGAPTTPSLRAGRSKEAVDLRSGEGRRVLGRERRRQEAQARRPGLLLVAACVQPTGQDLHPARGPRPGAAPRP